MATGVSHASYRYREKMARLYMTEDGPPLHAGVTITRLGSVGPLLLIGNTPICMGPPAVLSTAKISRSSTANPYENPKNGGFGSLMTRTGVGREALEGKGALKWTRLSCRTFNANAVRLQLHALAYNLGNFLRTLVTPEPIQD
jgi:hypothetical protein